MYSKSWEAFIVAIERAKKDLDFQKNEEYFFRGHSRTDYHLLPSLFRPLSTKLFTKSQLWDNESDSFYEFKARAKEVHSGNLNDWDILFFMQHHGARTRLLDWSESFGVALYFALLNFDPATSKPCIWLLNPYRLNETYYGDRDLYAPENLDNWNDDEEEYLSYSDYILYEKPDDILWWNKPIALYPIRRVDRLTTQGGYFTIHGKDLRPIEQMIPARKNIWRKIDLPMDAVDSAFLFLEQAGISHFTMFPDLDGLANYLNRKYYGDKII
jgi:hypothetical protein